MDAEVDAINSKIKTLICSICVFHWVLVNGLLNRIGIWLQVVVRHYTYGGTVADLNDMHPTCIKRTRQFVSVSIDLQRDISVAIILKQIRFFYLTLLAANLFVRFIFQRRVTDVLANWQLALLKNLFVLFFEANNAVDWFSVLSAMITWYILNEIVYFCLRKNFH